MPDLWVDHRGNEVRVPLGTTTCYDTTGEWRTHRLFGASADTPILQVMTRCGLRGGQVLGSDVVNCPECLERD